MKRTFLLVITFLTLSVSMFAQTVTGRLVGTISGPDGVLPGATVVVTDDKTGKEYTVTTDSQGGFVVPQLNSGTYTVKTTANGFKTSVVKNVIINVGTDYGFAATLEVGDVSATVTVTSGEDLVNSTNAELNRTINERQIKELPLNGRNPLQLILLQAGAASNPNQNTTINGFRTSSTNIIQDGVNVQDNFIRSNATDFSPGRASVGNVEQFTITTQAGADRGFGGPQIELVTPRGQNSFRGELFIFNRNSKFAANNFFNNAAGSLTATSPRVISGLASVGDPVAPRPFLNRNQFGGSVGGPIIKNKLFFFGYYEGLRLRTQVAKVTTTLTAAAKQGLLTYIDNAGVTRQVNLFTLPNTGTNPPVAINGTVTSRFLSRLPVGNTTEAGDGLNTTGYRFNQKSDTDRDQFTGRIDYQLNDANNVNGVFDYSKENNLRSDIDGSFNTIPAVVQPAINKRVALSWTTTPWATFTNQIRGGVLFSRPDFIREEATPTQFVVPTLITNPEVTFLNQGRQTDNYNLSNTSDYIWKNHSFRFGVQFQRVGINAYNDAGIVSTYNIGTNVNTPATPAVGNAAYIGGISATQRNTGNALYALLGGIISSGSQSFNVETQTSGFVPGATQRRKFGMDTLAFFGQDSWRVQPNFTLTLGLRYERHAGLKTKNGLAFEPIIAPGRDPVEAILDPTGAYQFVGGNAGKEGLFFKDDNNNFAPVVNASYSPSFKSGFGKWLFGGEGKSVFRGGFRFSYVNDEAVRAPDNALLGNQGLNFGASAINTATGTTALNDRLGGTITAVIPPTFLASRTYAQNNTAAFSNFGTVFAIDPNIQIPRVAEWNFGYQREFGNYAVEVRYVGSWSDNLWRSIDYNQIDIRDNGFAADFNRARSNLLICRTTAGCTTGGAYNAAVPGSQVLTVFPSLGSGGLLTNSTITAQLDAGTPADLALVYVQNALAGSVRFLPNPATGVANVFQNGAFSKYHSLQTEVRRRFSNGLEMQANYSFGKTITDGQGTAQTRVEAFLDNRNRDLDVSRADFDQTHILNLNVIYQLPFGKGKQFLNKGGWLDVLVGGWQATSIVRWASGSPITITDARGTLNRAGRAGRQTALTSLSKSELKQLFGVFRTANGIFFINPTAIGRNADGTVNTAGGGTGRGANGFGTPTFTGQVFFNNLPGQTSGLERAFLNGPSTFNWDASLVKNFSITETMRVQIRAEAFNVLNNVNFVPAQFLDINSTNFGRMTSTTAPRVMQFGARFLF